LVNKQITSNNGTATKHLKMQPGRKGNHIYKTPILGFHAALQGTNMYLLKALLKMIFLFPKWDM